MIIHEIIKRIHIVEDLSCSYDMRKKSIIVIMDYISSLIFIAPREKDFLLSLADTISQKVEMNSLKHNDIQPLTRLLCTKLYLTSEYETRMVICGTGILADTITEMLSHNYHVIPLDYLQKDKLISYINTYFVICSAEVDTSCLQQLPQDSIIHLFNYLQYEYMLAPEFYHRRWQFEHISKSLNGIITGISYFRDAIRSDYLDLKFGNLANRSQDLFYDFELFRYGHKLYPDITHAIIGIAPYSLRFDESRSKTLLPLLFANYKVTGTVHHCSEFDLYAKIYHAVRPQVERFFSADMIHEIFLRSYVTHYGTGSFPTNVVFNENTMTDQARLLAENEMKKKYEKPYEDTFFEYKKILYHYLDYLKDNKIRTIIVLPPFTRWYKEHWRKEYYDETLEVLRDYKEIFEFTLLDLTTLDLPDYYFRDYAHVNEIGAIHVAGLINETLDEME